MSETKRWLRFSVITPEGCAVDSEAVELTFPTHDGMVGVLPGHAAMITQLGIGLLRFRDTQNHAHAIFIDGGFGHVVDNHVSLLTGNALLASDISLPAAETALLEAQAMPADGAAASQVRQKALRRAQGMVALAKWHAS